MKTIQYFCLLIGWMMLAIPLSAQVSNTLHGIVWAQNGQPLSDVQIISSDSSSHTTTNSEGYFVINDLSTGKHEIRISHIGYETQVQSVQADYSLSDTLTFYLEPKRYQTPSAVVTATRTRRDIESVPEPVTIISDKQIQTSGRMRMEKLLKKNSVIIRTKIPRVITPSNMLFS